MDAHSAILRLDEIRMTKMTDIELLKEVHMPVGDPMAKEFMRCMLNMYEAGTMLYYAGNRLDAGK